MVLVLLEWEGVFGVDEGHYLVSVKAVIWCQ